mmetsp:Transcript_43083/g.111630  ORF Transcript_43083/g.111630 Transcript_43083/m.111630 type:complete len:271 (-) Transcript_43083:2207-3019(-)
MGTPDMLDVYALNWRCKSPSFLSEATSALRESTSSFFARFILLNSLRRRLFSSANSPATSALLLSSISDEGEGGPSKVMAFDRLRAVVKSASSNDTRARRSLACCSYSSFFFFSSSILSTRVFASTTLLRLRLAASSSPFLSSFTSARSCRTSASVVDIPGEGDLPLMRVGGGGRSDLPDADVKAEAAADTARNLFMPSTIRSDFSDFSDFSCPLSSPLPSLFSLTLIIADVCSRCSLSSLLSAGWLFTTTDVRLALFFFDISVACLSCL